jgi:hypothetical protein
MNRPRILLEVDPYDKFTDSTPNYNYLNKQIKHLLEWEKTNRLIKKGSRYYLPEGTLLYHASLDGQLDLNKYNNISFFGLNPEISIWYILEINESRCEGKSKKYRPHRYGFLYQFITNVDLPIEIMPDLYKNPKPGFSGPFKFLDRSKCRKKVCFHPQMTVRGSMEHDRGAKREQPFYEINIEVTMNMSRSEYEDKLELENVYVIDTEILRNNRDDFDFDESESIVENVDISEIYDC